MARDRANIMTGIWGNPDVRDLPPLQQWLYLKMWTHPDTTYVGVLEWRPGRLAQLSAGTTPDLIRSLVPLLQERLFVVLDEESEEILLRPYLRHDGLLKQPKLSVSMANAYASTGSTRLRGVIVHELRRLQKEHPDWAAWGASQVQTILKHPEVDPAVLVQGLPQALPLPLPMGLPQSAGNPLPLPTTTATTTATSIDNVQPAAARSPYSKAFEEWWPHYPRRESKGDAFKAWESTRKARTLPPFQEMVSAADAYGRKVAGTDPKFVKLAGGWIRDRKWEDETVAAGDTDSWAAYRG